MVEPAVIETGEWPGFERIGVAGPSGMLSARIGGPADGEAVLFCHSILTSSAIWARQAASLAARGFRVVCVDMRGHGLSEAVPGPYAMDDLVADIVTVLDVLELARVHFVGVSQGGMIGFGIGARHQERLASLLVVGARADAPAPFAAAWDDRIALVNSERSVENLAFPTAERWFGADFLRDHPSVRGALLSCIRQTSAEGFIGCARAIQGLDYISEIPAIRPPAMLAVGEHDALLVQPMRDLQPLFCDCVFEIIPNAGHLPQVDQPQLFSLLLTKHLNQFV